MKIDHTRNAVLGAFIIVAIVVGIWAAAFFDQQLAASRTYPMTLLFDDAQGIGKQADVYLSGVQIGTVSDVGLSPTTGKAQVRILIEKQYRVPIGSEPAIESGILGGQSYIDFTPPPRSAVLPSNSYYPPRAVISGQESVDFAALQARAGGLMDQFGQTAKKMDALLDEATKTTTALDQMVSDPRLKSSLIDTVRNLDMASQQGLQLTNDIRTMLAQDNMQARGALGNVTGTTAALRDMTTRNSGRLDEIVRSLAHTTATMDQLTTQADSTLTKGQTVQNLSDTIAGLKQASETLNKIESSIAGITTDPSVQSDLKTTVHNASVASANTSLLIQRLTALTGHSNNSVLGNVKIVSRLDFTQRFQPSKFRTDFNVYAPFGANDIGQAGIYDLTGANKLNLQYGQRSAYNKLFTYRAGLYASQIGVGVDYDLFGDRTFSVDLYDPNRISLDARQKLRLNKESSLWFGVQDVPRTNSVALGFELQH
jgi:phospholipid/cholesterol/gamma-HCH transport system substrate-binding protein